MNNKFLKGFFLGCTVFIVGCGPSLRGFDFALLEGKKTIAVNLSYLYFQSDLLVYVDRVFETQLRKKPATCKILTSNIGYSKYSQIGLCDHPSENNDSNLYGRGSTIAFAISAALIGGADKIYILGLDLYTEKGYGHFYPGDIDESRFENQLNYFDPFSIYDNKIINLSLKSRVDVFPKKHYLQVL